MTNTQPQAAQVLTRSEIDALMTEHYPLDSLLRENVDAFEACIRDAESAILAKLQAATPSFSLSRAYQDMKAAQQAATPASDEVAHWVRTRRVYHEYENSAKEDTVGFLTTDFSAGPQRPIGEGWEPLYTTPPASQPQATPAEPAPCVHPSWSVDEDGACTVCGGIDHAAIVARPAQPAQAVELPEPFGYVSDGFADGLHFSHKPWPEMHEMLHSTAPVYSSAQMRAALSARGQSDHLPDVRKMVPLTDEQIESLRERLATHIAASGMLAGDDSWDHDFARLAIDNFCRINGLEVKPSTEQGGKL